MTLLGFLMDLEARRVTLTRKDGRPYLEHGQRLPTSALAVAHANRSLIERYLDAVERAEALRREIDETGDPATGKEFMNTIDLLSTLEGETLQ